MSPRDRVHDLRSDLGEWGQDEPAEGDPRVGEFELGRVEELARVNQEVEVERPLAPADPGPAELVLDALRHRQQLERLERRLQLRSGVEERPLAAGPPTGRVSW